MRKWLSKNYFFPGVFFLTLGLVAFFFGFLSVPVARAQRPLKYFAVEAANPEEFADLAQHHINTAIITMYANDPDYNDGTFNRNWEEVLNAANQYNINIVIWPWGGNADPCYFPWNHTTDISAMHSMLDYFGPHDKFIGVINGHEWTWSCPMSLGNMAVIKSKLRDYVWNKFGREIKAWNYASGPYYHGGNITGWDAAMDVALTWMYPFNGDSNVPSVLSMINYDRGILDSQGSNIELAFLFQTFAQGGHYRMPTAAEMKDVGCQILGLNALDGFVFYTWQNPKPGLYSQYLANSRYDPSGGDRWEAMSYIYENCVSPGGPTPTPTPLVSPTLTPSPQTTPTLTPSLPSKDPDLSGDGEVNGIDMKQLLAAWGPISSSAPEDLDSNGKVNSLDAGRMVAEWTGGPPASPTPTPTSPPGATPTPTLPPVTPPPTSGLDFYGVEFAGPSDFPTLRDQLSVNTVLTSLSPGAGCASWTSSLDNAASYGIKLIPILGWKADECAGGAGGGPVWVYHGDRKNAASGYWDLTVSGDSFLGCMQNYLNTGGQGLAAVYGLHESYWMGTTACGYGTDVQQELYSEIKARCPLCKVYSEVGNLYFWETNNEYGGSWSRIQDGAFDYAGIWLYPFNGEGSMSQAMSVINNDRQLIESKGLAIKLVFLMQTFGAGGYRMPSASEMYDLGCRVVGSGKVEGALWYTWQGGPYSDYLVNHPDYYSVSQRVLAECGG